jgi:hypothetical protein
MVLLMIHGQAGLNIGRGLIQQSHISDRATQGLFGLMREQNHYGFRAVSVCHPLSG